MTNQRFLSTEGVEWKKAQMAIKKFIDVTKIHLDVLQEHRKSMAKHRLRGDHAASQRGKRFADRTVRQLVVDLNQIASVACDLSPSDLTRLQKEIGPTKRRMDSEISEFLAECQLSEVGTDFGSADGDESSKLINPAPHNYSAQQMQHSTKSGIPLKAAVEELEQNALAHTQLTEDIEILHECMKELASLIEGQGETVDNIETHVEKTAVHISKGQRLLEQISLSKTVIGGAVIGALVCGPAGLMVGMKVGVVAALGGSALGAYSSKIIGRKVANSKIKKGHEAPTGSSYSKID